jgi:uncharacterized membrane protein
MELMVAGLIVFLGVHSMRVFAEPLRAQWVARLGDKPWKGLYALASLVGFVLLVYGYGLARQSPITVWAPPRGMAHLAALLTLVAFVMLVAAYVPGNGIKARLHHPMVLAVKVWALAHLLSNGTLADMVLFGAFLVWSVLLFRASRQRDRVQGTVYAPGVASRTWLTGVVGLGAWGVFAFWGHARLIGVSPLGV